MGLDITVHKLRKASKDILKKYNFFRLINDYTGEYTDNTFPDWSKKFITYLDEDWFDWEKYKEITGFDIKQHECVGYSCTDEGDFISFKNLNTKKVINIDIHTIPIYKKKIPIIGYEEVGYQRKGLNNKFYSDYNEDKIGYFVWSKKELERYMQEYSEDKEYFKENIIDSFIEGKCCVTFDW